jgi:flagellar biosynthetic protein FliQ
VSTADLLLRVAREGLFLTVVVSAPIILASLAIGLMVSIFQATTQIQEQTLSFAPKLVAVMVSIAAFSPWIGSQLTRFARALFELVPRVGG